jgi:hypothetical protein
MQVASVEAKRSMSEERAGSNGRASVSKPPAEEQPTLVASLMDQVKTMALRGSIYASFFLAKQPKRIRQVSLPNLLNPPLFSIPYLLDIWTCSFSEASKLSAVEFSRFIL